MSQERSGQKLVLESATNAKSFAEHYDEFLQYGAYQKVCALLRKNLNDAKAKGSGGLVMTKLILRRTRPLQHCGDTGKAQNDATQGQGKESWPLASRCPQL